MRGVRPEGRGPQFSANRHLSGPACKGYANYAAGIIQHRRAGSSSLCGLKSGVPMQMSRRLLRFEGRRAVTRANQDIDTRLPPWREGIGLPRWANSLGLKYFTVSIHFTRTLQYSSLCFYKGIIRIRIWIVVLHIRLIYKLYACVGREREKEREKERAYRDV